MKKNLPQTDIYAILSDACSGSRGNVETARFLLKAGIKIIQYREKDFPMRRKYEECVAISRLCREYDACFIVNDDAGLAIACGAEGLHLGQDDLPSDAARRVVGADMLIGLSVATPEEIDKALTIPEVDYLGVGPVFATSTKPDAAPPGGVALLEYALKRSHLPVVAIGGINRENIGSLAERECKCFAIVSDLIGAEDLIQRVFDLRSAFSV
ncbi:thiamine phosphate synthase [Dehalogenimonas etheniformans]|uniref:Thiamine-phosphate synthase n=1 Tax=Dehalogenimonas etheniformans TaxID=1536648 RepID=A0A2P5P5M2_9CHLR|nr:thiamine phosphate synthase [Dehalogenimonas etheniformans]PPD57596.1 thiamine phosphate synthase [Dehalogenimonas etheniformans]QNT75936.1 thiamine phosphate synthase [Dehalogenimonas etheniformans]